MLSRSGQGESWTINASGRCEDIGLHPCFVLSSSPRISVVDNMYSGDHSLHSRIAPFPIWIEHRSGQQRRADALHHTTSKTLHLAGDQTGVWHARIRGLDLSSKEFDRGRLQTLKSGRLGHIRTQGRSAPSHHSHECTDLANV